MTVRRLSLIGFATVLGACSPTLPPPAPLPQPASQAGQDAADASVKCFGDAAFRLDDHQSDAQIVAINVENACPQDLEDTLVVYSQGMNARTAELFKENARLHWPEQAINAVLRERAMTGQNSN